MLSFTRMLGVMILMCVLGACRSQTPPAAEPEATGAPVADAAPAADAAPVATDGAAAPAECTPATVAGDWTTVAGADFEEMTLGADGTYSSFLHARPFASGSWVIEGSALVLSSDDGQTLRIEALTCGQELRGRGPDGEISFSRTAAAQ